MHDRTLTELANDLAAKRVSAVELTKHFLARIERFDDALNAFVDHAKGVRLGDGLDEETTMGPLVSAEQRERVERFIEIGQSEATLAVQGSRPTDPRLANGYFVPPTIFADVDNSDTIAREEIFGPVMSVIPFASVEDVVEMSNDNAYGLAAAIWTNDIKKALTTARALRAGVVWINDTQPAPTEMPWGGTKQSGIGRELGDYGFNEYRQIKHVWQNTSTDRNGYLHFSALSGNI